MSLKLKLCGFTSVSSLLKKEINAFDSVGIEGLVATRKSLQMSGNTLMILTEMSFMLASWIL